MILGPDLIHLFILRNEDHGWSLGCRTEWKWLLDFFLLNSCVNDFASLLFNNALFIRLRKYFLIVSEI